MRGEESRDVPPSGHLTYLELDQEVPLAHGDLADGDGFASGREVLGEFTRAAVTAL